MLVAMRLKSSFLICLKMMCANLRRKRMQGTTVKSRSKHFMMLQCLLNLYQRRYTSLISCALSSLMQLSSPAKARMVRLRRQSMAELKASAFRIVRYRLTSTRSSRVKTSMRLQVTLQNLSLASKSRLLLYCFLSNFLKTAVLSLLMFMPKRKRKRLLGEELRMITKSTKSMQMMKKCTSEYRKLTTSSIPTSEGRMSELSRILGSLPRQVLPVVVSIISKIIIESPTLYSLTVFCPRKKWQRQERFRKSSSCTISEHPNTMMQAKKEVRFILPAPTFGSRMLRQEAMRSNPKSTMVSQTVAAAQKKQSQQQASMRRATMLKPLKVCLSSAFSSCACSSPSSARSCSPPSPSSSFWLADCTNMVLCLFMMGIQCDG